MIGIDFFLQIWSWVCWELRSCTHLETLVLLAMKVCLLSFTCPKLGLVRVSYPPSYPQVIVWIKSITTLWLVVLWYMFRVMMSGTSRPYFFLFFHKFNPTFPNGCPYVLSVGATTIPAGGSAKGREVAASFRYVIFRPFPVLLKWANWRTVASYSAGGFSNYFSLPSYQAAAMKTYYKFHKPPYGSDRYKNTQKARGYPDVRYRFFSIYKAFEFILILHYAISSANGKNCELILLITYQQ